VGLWKLGLIEGIFVGGVGLDDGELWLGDNEGAELVGDDDGDLVGGVGDFVVVGLPVVGDFVVVGLPVVGDFVVVGLPVVVGILVVGESVVVGRFVGELVEGERVVGVVGESEGLDVAI